MRDVCARSRRDSLAQDLLYISQPQGTRKRRVHFHVFMLEVHARLHTMRGQAVHQTDPLAVLAHELAQLLCFDEFQVDGARAAHPRRMRAC